jgi:hypothetical protein
MQSRVLAVLTIVFFSFSAEAQSDSSALKPGYFFSLHAGGLVGKKEDGTFFTSSLIQGLRFNRLAIGLGIGYDAYVDWRVMPVFINANYDFSRYRGNSFFVQLNGGVAKAWTPILSDVEIVYNEAANININPLLGYRIVGDKFNLYLSAGYKFQMLEYGWGYSGGYKTYVRRDIGRACLQLGFGIH